MIEFLRNICGDLKLIYLFPKTSQPGHEIRYTSGASHFLIREVGAAHISTRSGAVQIVLHVSDWSWNRDGFVEKPQIFLSGDLMLLVMWKNWSNKKNKENNLYRKNNISIYIYKSKKQRHSENAMKFMYSHLWHPGNAFFWDVNLPIWATGPVPQSDPSPIWNPTTASATVGKVAGFQGWPLEVITPINGRITAWATGAIIPI